MAFLNLCTKYNGFLIQFLTVITATLNAVSDGMNYGWSSPMLPRLKKENSPIKITEEDEGYLESILLIAGLVGLPITTYLVDKIGRKQSTLTATCTCVVGWTMIAFANNVIYLYVARFIMGIAADIAFISSPMYVAEIAHKSFRGYLSGIIYVMSYSGTVIMYIIGPYVDFYVPSIVAIAFLFTQICTLPFVPDSPYFLILNGKIDQAKKSLIILRGTDDVKNELQEIISAIEEQKQEEKGKVTDLVTVPSVRRAIIIMTILNGGQHMAGYTALSMNLNAIFAKAKSTYLDDEVSVILFGSLMLVGSICAISLVDKFGRRTLLMFSTISTTLTLIVTGVYFYLQESRDVSSVSWIPVASVMAFAVTFKFGIGIVPIVLTAELFPVSVKSYGMAFADGMFVIFGSLSVLLYNFFVYKAGGMHISFFFFAGCTFFTAIFVYFFVPETKGKTLEEVQIILKN